MDVETEAQVGVRSPRARILENPKGCVAAATVDPPPEWTLAF